MEVRWCHYETDGIILKLQGTLAPCYRIISKSDVSLTQGGDAIYHPHQGF
jgi:hypothetical protein